MCFFIHAKKKEILLQPNPIPYCFSKGSLCMCFSVPDSSLECTYLHFCTGVHKDVSLLFEAKSSSYHHQGGQVRVWHK